MVCWGCGLYGLDPPAGSFSQVSAGGEHTCGLKSDGTVACWGYNYFGQSTPPGGSFSQVSAGHWHTCGLRTDGLWICWGDNEDGQCGYWVHVPLVLKNSP